MRYTDGFEFDENYRVKICPRCENKVNGMTITKNGAGNMKIQITHLFVIMWKTYIFQY